MKSEAMEREVLAVDSGVCHSSESILWISFPKSSIPIVYMLLFELSVYFLLLNYVYLNCMDLEFNQVLQSDACRLQQLQCHTSGPGHPFNRFSWGKFVSVMFLFRVCICV